MRVLILGTGGVGGYFGARLAENGEDVLFVARGQHLAALRGKGLRLKSVSGDVHLTDIRASDRIDPTFQPELVLVCVKTWQLDDAIALIRPVLEPDTIVMPLLNGVEACGQLCAGLGKEHVVGGLCGLIAYIEAPGVIRHAAVDPFIRLGELDGRRTDRIAGLATMFGDAPGVDIAVPDDIIAALWMKFLFVSPTGAVGAVTRAPMGVFRAQPESRELLRRAMQEIYDVAIAKGIALRREAVDKTLDMVDGLPESGTSSMQRDLMSGRRSELDAQVGAMVRLGTEVGVATPVYDYFLASFLPSERRSRGEIDFDIQLN